MIVDRSEMRETIARLIRKMHGVMAANSPVIEEDSSFDEVEPQSEETA